MALLVLHLSLLSLVMAHPYHGSGQHVAEAHPLSHVKMNHMRHGSSNNAEILVNVTSIDREAWVGVQYICKGVQKPNASNWLGVFTPVTAIDS